MSTLEQLQEILIKDYKLTREQLAPEAELATLGVDSLGLVELMFAIEERFGVQIPSERVELHTVADVVGYIDGLVAARDAAPAPRAPRA